MSDVFGSTVHNNNVEIDDASNRESCLVCGTKLLNLELYIRYRLCPTCRFHYSMTARDRIDSLVDAGSFKETNRSVISLDPLSFSSRTSYRQKVFQDQQRTGLTEAIVTGSCTIGGTPTELIVMDFGFMGGSMGSVVGEKVSLELERAAKRGVPIIAVVTSGGARIQEGVLSLMQMAKTSFAANKVHNKGLPFISVLSNPATGQAYASFANLADVILAEPGAIVGLAPMRTIRELSSDPLPSGSHTSESHLAHGMVDRIVDRSQLRDLLAVLLDLLSAKYKVTARRKQSFTYKDQSTTDAWQSVQLARNDLRPTSIDYIGRVVTNFVELHGDRSYGDDPAIIAGLGDLGGQTVVIVGQERGRSNMTMDRNDGMTSPEGFRKIQRAIKIASKFQFPLITLIDTPGALQSLDTEERGLGNSLAQTMADMGSLDAPSIAVLIGEGGSEGALSIGVANRVLIMENAIYTVISPESAAELVYQDETKADELAESLKLTAWDCMEMGIADVVIQEPPGGAHNNKDESARELRRVLLRELSVLQKKSPRRLLSERYKKFRKMGEYSSYFRLAIDREVKSLQGRVATGVLRIAKRNKKPPSGYEPTEGK